MKRIHNSTPRPNWEDRVVRDGMIYYEDYWCESARYELNLRERDMLAEASATLESMCHHAVQFMLDHPVFMHRMGVPDWAFPEIERSWRDKDPSVYGRMDLRFGGDCERAEQDPSLRVPKFLEYNADTATSLLETSVVQRRWQQETGYGAGQWNNLHEALVKTWQEQMEAHEHRIGRQVDTIHFVHSHQDHQSGEDWMNTYYMSTTAEAAGYSTNLFYLEHVRTSIEPHDGSFHYVDMEKMPIDVLFKLYPWEELGISEDRGFITSPLLRNGTTWVEPSWKMLLSNKGLLAVLWHLYQDAPEREFLLPAFFADDHDMPDFVRKPLNGREGANISVHQSGKHPFGTDGRYGNSEFVDQAFAPLPNFTVPSTGADNFAVVGVWMVGGKPAGLGIRESDSLVTHFSNSRFVPHVLV